MQRALIAFEGKHVVAPLINDLLGNGALTAHGINSHGSVFEIKHGEKFGNGRDFVRFGVGGQLSKDKALLGALGRNHV